MSVLPIIDRLLAKIDQWDTTKRALVGVDGYVDKIQQAVQVQSVGGDQYFPTLDTFGAHVQAAAGRSAQVELATHLLKPGGNAPIMSHALGTLGIRNHCLGTLGEGQPAGVFQSMHRNCKPLTLGPPAESNALEFNDGKLILSDLSAFQNMDWQLVKQTIGLPQLQKITQETALIALVGWCNPPHATAIWRGILQEVLQPLNGTQPELFFDLADPSKKSDAQIMEVIALMNEFAKMTNVTLGLNENETLKLYQCICRTHGQTHELSELADIVNFVYEQLAIDVLVVHPLDRCLATDGQRLVELHGHLVRQPKVSTGGGDNFNAGYCLGLLAGSSLEERLVLAMATSGAYVQNGMSPDRESLKSFLQQLKTMNHPTS